jgi:hypothetical protein
LGEQLRHRPSAADRVAPHELLLERDLDLASPDSRLQGCVIALRLVRISQGEFTHGVIETGVRVQVAADYECVACLGMSPRQDPATAPGVNSQTSASMTAA